MEILSSYNIQALIRLFNNIMSPKFSENIVGITVGITNVLTDLITVLQYTLTVVQFSDAL